VSVLTAVKYVEDEITVRRELGNFSLNNKKKEEIRTHNAEQAMAYKVYRRRYVGRRRKRWRES
jgi:hypothetical protein